MLSPSLLSLLSSRSFARSLSFAHRIASRDFSSFYLTDRTPEPPSLRCHPFAFHPLAVHREHLPSFYLDVQSSQVISSKRKLLAKMRWRWENTSPRASSLKLLDVHRRNAIRSLFVYSKQGYESISWKKSIRNLTLKTSERNFERGNIRGFVIKISCDCQF